MLAFKPLNLVLAPGVAVEIVGVVSQPQLNGTVAHVQSFDDVRGRYVLDVPGSERPQALKSANCRVVLPVPGGGSGGRGGHGGQQTDVATGGEGRRARLPADLDPTST